MNRQLLIFWSVDTAISFENDISQPIVYSGSFLEDKYLIYGVINDSDITKIKLYTNEGDAFTLEEFYDDLFYFCWENDGSENEKEFDKLVGYNNDDEIVYEITYE